MAVIKTEQHDESAVPVNGETKGEVTVLVTGYGVSIPSGLCLNLSANVRFEIAIPRQVPYKCLVVNSIFTTTDSTSNFIMSL
jgi:hypothetical protein